MLRNRSKLGFTLPEIILVCSLISMVALIGVGHYSDIEETADNQFQNILCMKIVGAVRQFYNDTDEPPLYIAELLANPKFKEDVKDAKSSTPGWWWRDTTQPVNENLKFSRNPYIDRCLQYINSNNSREQQTSEFRIIYNVKLSAKMITSQPGKTLPILGTYVNNSNNITVDSNFHLFWDINNNEIGVLFFEDKMEDFLIYYEFDFGKRILQLKYQDFDKIELKKYIKIYWTGVPCTKN